jgi:hypothetical protein
MEQRPYSRSIEEVRAEQADDRGIARGLAPPIIAFSSARLRLSILILKSQFNNEDYQLQSFHLIFCADD